MNKKYIFGLTAILTLFTPVKTSAHCPLCTGGAGAAAVAAAYFGVKFGALGVLLGGFTTALALWLAHKPKKEYIKYQPKLIFWFIYASTLVPFYYMFNGDYTSRYVSLGGDYGSLTNRTYLIDLFIVGAILGSLVVYWSPDLSAWISKKRDGKHIKFQGLILSLILLIAGGLLLQVWPR